MVAGLAVLCLISGVMAVSSVFKVARTRSTAQAFDVRLTEASGILNQQATETKVATNRQATETQIASSILATETAAKPTRTMSDPFNALLTLEFGPQSGKMDYDDDSKVEKQCTNVEIRDFVAEAVFYNPYSASFNKWNYGFLFRHTGNNTQYRVVVSSLSKWYLYLWEDVSLGVMAEGNVPNLLTGKNDFNTMKFVARGDIGYLYINDVLISSMNLDRRSAPGDVCAGTGFFTGSELAGYSAGYEDFAVWSLSTSP